MMSLIRRFIQLTTREIVLILVLSATLGVFSWGWSFVYELFKPVLKFVGLKYLLAGFWLLPSIFLSHIVRKPGVAVLASLMAALVQSVLSHWGPMSLVWGLVQGLAAEMIFAIFLYRNWNTFVLVAASIMCATASYGLDYFIYDYKILSTQFNLIQITSFIVSAIIFAGLMSQYLVKRLLKIGLLSQFNAGKI